jgi:antitoxin (DNA-binding transcriptional repressor) of toxin-antitoxin stability system
MSRGVRLRALEDPMPDPEDALLDAVAAGRDDRVLVLGRPSLELVCASARRGCRAALGSALPPAHPGPAEVVLAPRVRDAAEAESIAQSARRALQAGLRGGRLAMRLPGRGALARGRALALRLAALGFSEVRLRRAGGAVLVTGACLPAAGR